MTHSTSRICISGEQLATLFGCTSAWIRKLYKEGVLPRDGTKYPRDSCVKAYVAYLTDQNRRATKVAAENAVKEARVREINQRIAERERVLISTAEATDALDHIVSAMLQALDGLPRRFTRDTDQQHALEKLIDDIRREVSNGLDDDIVAMRTGGTA